MTDLERAIADMVQQAVDKLTAPERLYSAEDIAKRYHCSAGTASVWIRAGLFGETINTGKRNRLVTEEGIRKYDLEHIGPAHDGERISVPRGRKKKAPVNPGRI